MIKTAKWIGCPKDIETPIIKKTFTLAHPVSGKIDITGLGYFQLYVNGKRVSNDYFTPVFSDYQKRPLDNLSYPISDTFSHRIYYLQYDLTDFMRDGENTFEIILGNGWYRQNERSAEGNLSFGDELKALFCAAFTLKSDETVIIDSDGSESCSASFITFNNIFIGEVHDARLINKPHDEYKVRVLPDSQSPLMLQTCPSDKIIRTITPRIICESENETIYDTGENITGWVRIETRAPEGEVIHIEFSENLDENNMLDFTSTGAEYTCKTGKKQIQTDTFICDGNERTFEPRFSWHGFRYFKVKGTITKATVAVVHSDVAVTSQFNSDNTALNWLYDAYIRSQLTNMHGGVVSDCPHRERLGYTGDGQITAESSMLLLDSCDFYEKWIYDILDCQDIHNGHVQHTAPFMGGGGGPGCWGCAVVVVPYQHYKNFADKDLLAHCYPHMRKWVSYMKSRSENYLVVREEEGGWCLGDWAALDKIEIPDPFVNTCYFIKSLQLLIEIAHILGNSNDADDYREYISHAKKSVIDTYYSSDTGSFCDGVQGADAFALDIELQKDERTLNNLIAKYDKLRYFDTGFIGTDVLIDVLFRSGNLTLAFDLLTSDKKGSYSWMMNHGATTIWEYFHGAHSHNHPMFGGPVRHLFKSILGITQTTNSLAFKDIVIAPQIPEGLNDVSGQVKTKHGIIGVTWHREGDTVNLKATIPNDISAAFVYNKKTTELQCGENSISFIR